VDGRFDGKTFLGYLRELRRHCGKILAVIDDFSVTCVDPVDLRYHDIRWEVSELKCCVDLYDVPVGVNP